MRITKDDHCFEIDGHEVAVTGRTGPVHATWTLVIDGRAVDSATVAGNSSLRAELPDGSALRAKVHQSLLGPTEVAIERDGQEIERFKGFVA